MLWGNIITYVSQSKQSFRSENFCFIVPLRTENWKIKYQFTKIKHFRSSNGSYNFLKSVFKTVLSKITLCLTYILAIQLVKN